MTTIDGDVEDTAFKRLAGANVQMVNGPQAGASTLTDASGQFSFSGRFTADVTLRASLEGYVTATITVHLANGTGPEAPTGFRLQSTEPLVQIDTALYDLTVTADSSCTDVPEDLRTVSFAAMIAPNVGQPLNPPYTDYSVNLTGTFPGPLSFGLGAAGNRLGFEIDGGLVKAIPPSTYIELAGSANAAMPNLAPSAVSIPFFGLYDYCVLKTPMPSDEWTTCHILPADTIVRHVECFGNHQMILKKR